MKIEQLDGLAPRLFSLVGPMAMNPKVLKANNNYPFKTTERFQWYVAIEKRKVVGFLPIEQKSGYSVINNYYIQNDDADILKELLDAVTSRENLYAVIQTKHEEVFSNCGFRVEHRWTKYIKMIYHTEPTENE